MAYPSLEQYNEALQSPQLVLQDPELKAGRIKATGLGLPLALCGGFALTYSVEVGSKRFALRCFHKESRELERRYQAIAARLKQIGSPYFLPFDFIPNGIRIQGQAYPIVKMAWAQGRTLAEFLESEHRDGAALARLRLSLTHLARFLEQSRIAHGDIQPENVMVSGDGSAVQLIDYDGLFVEALQGSKATELGQINFQHPGRTAANFDEKLDRFSFISLDVALQALIASPALWAASRSEPSALVFRRNDILDPGASAVFRAVMQLPGVKTHAENLAKVALADFGSLPSLDNFLRGELGSASAVVFKSRTTAVTMAYQGAYPVCDATDYDQVLAQVGSRVELIGQVHSVKKGWGANRKPYVFLNFSDWRGRAVKLAIWSDGLKAIDPDVPDETWVGHWVSVTGLVDPAYRGKARTTSYMHLSITITAAGQIQTLTKDEAQFRLRPSAVPRPTVPSPGRNVDVVKSMVGARTVSRSSSRAIVAPAPSPAGAQSANQQVLEQMKARARGSSPAGTAPAASAPRSAMPPPPPRPAKAKSDWAAYTIWAIIIIAVLKACAG